MNNFVWVRDQKKHSLGSKPNETPPVESSLHSLRSEHLMHNASIEAHLTAFDAHYHSLRSFVWRCIKVIHSLTPFACRSFVTRWWCSSHIKHTTSCDAQWSFGHCTLVRDACFISDYAYTSLIDSLAHRSLRSLLLLASSSHRILTPTIHCTCIGYVPTVSLTWNSPFAGKVSAPSRPYWVEG